MKTFCSIPPMPRIEPIPPIVTWEKVFQTTRPTKNHAAKTPCIAVAHGGRLCTEDHREDGAVDDDRGDGDDEGPEKAEARCREPGPQVPDCECPDEPGSCPRRGLASLLQVVHLPQFVRCQPCLL